MKSVIQYSFLGIVAVMITVTGCSSSGASGNDVKALNAQIGVITDELVRLDQAIMDLRAAAQAKQAIPSAVAVPSSGAGNIYRTPSGFELPAVEIQQALKNAGYYSGEIDGKVGAQSEEAVKAFQKDHGLNVDGVVGRNTWGKLKVYLGNPVK